MLQKEPVSVRCPECGAPLDLDMELDEQELDAPFVRCAYCDSQIDLSDRQRYLRSYQTGSQRRINFIKLDDDGHIVSRKWMWIVVILFVVFLYLTLYVTQCSMSPR